MNNNNYGGQSTMILTTRPTNHVPVHRYITDVTSLFLSHKSMTSPWFIYLYKSMIFQTSHNTSLLEVLQLYLIWFVQCHYSDCSVQYYLLRSHQVCHLIEMALGLVEDVVLVPPLHCSPDW